MTNKKKDKYVIKIVGYPNEYVGDVRGRSNIEMTTVAGTMSAKKFDTETQATKTILKYGIRGTVEIHDDNNKV